MESSPNTSNYILHHQSAENMVFASTPINSSSESLNDSPNKTLNTNSSAIYSIDKSSTFNVTVCSSNRKDKESDNILDHNKDKLEQDLTVKKSTLKLPDMNNIQEVNLLNSNINLPPFAVNLNNIETYMFKKNFNYFLNADHFPLAHLPSTLVMKKHPNKKNKDALQQLLDPNELPIITGNKELYSKDCIKDKVYKKRKLDSQKE